MQGIVQTKRDALKAASPFAIRGSISVPTSFSIVSM